MIKQHESKHFDFAWVYSMTDLSPGSQTPTEPDWDNVDTAGPVAVQNQDQNR